jgi:hypothetical protein
VRLKCEGTMDEHPTIINFRRKLCSVYGYDENLKYLGRHKATRVQEGPKAFLEPRDFLQFAIDEAKTLEQEKSRTNCLSNCKRAIDAQIDRLIRKLGYSPLARRQRWNIPTKLDFISDSGIVAPKILHQVNRLRNGLEHEFALPSKPDVEDALDVATLFVSYGELVHVPTLNICTEKETVHYDYDAMVFHFFDTDPGWPEPEVEPTVSIPYDDPRFQDFYNFLMKIVPSMARSSRLGEDVQA